MPPPEVTAEFEAYILQKRIQFALEHMSWHSKIRGQTLIVEFRSTDNFWSYDLTYLPFMLEAQ